MMKRLFDWFLKSTFHQVWLKLFTFNLLMIPLSIVLFLIQEDVTHLYMGLFWSFLALVGLFIREGLLHDRSNS